jgi:uncharacterized protein (DUF305 family)
MRNKSLMFASIIAVTLTACGKTDTSANDSAAATEGADTMAGMAGMAGMPSTPARDADQEFLRMMVDHHQGMLVMADTALRKAAAQDVKTDATKMRDKQRAEQQKMQDMLKTQYSEDKMPMVTPGNASMITMMAGASGAAFDRQFREHVIMHHEEGIKMVDQFSPRLTRPEVKQMAAKMKADQTREIAELRKELQSS